MRSKSIDPRAKKNNQQFPSARDTGARVSRISNNQRNNILPELFESKSVSNHNSIKPPKKVILGPRVLSNPSKLAMSTDRQNYPDQDDNLKLTKAYIKQIKQNYVTVKATNTNVRPTPTDEESRSTNGVLKVPKKSVSNKIGSKQ